MKATARHKSSINPFPNKHLFFHVCSTSLLKTLWEKEKLLKLLHTTNQVLNLSQRSTCFFIYAEQVFWKHWGKGEIAGNEQFLLFPQCFLTFRKTLCHFHQISNCRLLSLWVWKSLKFFVSESDNPEILLVFHSVEKIVGKGKKGFSLGASKVVIVWWRVKLPMIFQLNLTHSHTMTPFDTSGSKPFENTVGKGEIAGNEQFLLFQQCFLPVWIIFFYFRQVWSCRLQTLSVWNSLKFVVW